MSVKHRITLLVTAAGFIASLIFSLAIYYELIEQPFDVLDFELTEEANRAVKVLEDNNIKSDLESINPRILESFPTWLKIYGHDSERVLWHSKLAEQISIPAVKPGLASTVEAMLRDDKIDFGQDNRKKAAFRTRTFELMANGKKMVVQVALPMERLKEEIQDLIFGLIIGLLISTLALIIISYFVAGRILRPVGRMKDLAQTISDKNLEQRIPVKNEKDEFNELARTINMMLDRLQFSFVRQRDFLFDTSHELKTPLTTIRLAIDEICSSEDMKNLQSSSSASLLRVNQQVVRMERMVKDLLNLSALEVLTSIDPKPINLTKILFSLIEDYRLLAEAKNIHIEINFPDELVIQGDEEKIKRAFSNILDNAVKYNVDHGRIKISATNSDEDLCIKINNTGPQMARIDRWGGFWFLRVRRRTDLSV